MEAGGREAGDPGGLGKGWRALAVCPRAGASAGCSASQEVMVQELWACGQGLAAPARGPCSGPVTCPWTHCVGVTPRGAGQSLVHDPRPAPQWQCLTSLCVRRRVFKARPRRHLISRGNVCYPQCHRCPAERPAMCGPGSQKRASAAAMPLGLRVHVGGHSSVGTRPPAFPPPWHRGSGPQWTSRALAFLVPVRDACSHPSRQHATVQTDSADGQCGRTVRTVWMDSVDGVDGQC